MSTVTPRSQSVARRAATLVAAVAFAVALSGCQLSSLLAVEPAPANGASATATSYLAEIRRAHDLPPLAADPTLELAAEKQAGYMAATGLMEHDTGRGRDFANRMKRIDMKKQAAENIAYGRWGYDGLFQTWMDSPGHRRNMLEPKYTRFGLASAQGTDGRRYWSLVLAE